MRILLASGLPLCKPHSFSRQLSLLASAFKEAGWEPILTDGSLKGLERSRAGLLLGYPDMFPAATAASRSRAADIPLFLWAQFSKRPDPRSLSGLRPVPLTPATAKLLEEAGVAAAGPVIPHGVDARLFKPAECGGRGERPLEGRGFVVGAVGANTARKRLNAVIGAFARFLRLLPGGLDGVAASAASLIVKTDQRVSPEGVDLPALSRLLGVAGRVSLIAEELAPSDMAGLFQSLDILLLLSEWEGFGIPAVEAMACGVPVACPPIPGPGEIVPYQDLLIAGGGLVREGGTVLHLADEEEAARVLFKAWRSPSLMKGLGRKGRAEVEKRYDIRIVVGQWRGLIEGTLAETDQ